MRPRSALVACLCAALAAPADAHDAGVVVTAALDRPPIARLNPRLVGVGWDPVPITDEAMAPLSPDLVRIDAGLEHLYPGGSDRDPAAFRALAHQVDEARAIGGRPLVILSYMPPWLADAGPGDPRDPTRLPPRDTATWGRLVEGVVGRLARDHGVRWFEAWNEPDWPVFWQGSREEWLERIYRPSADAVARVEERTGLDLRYGGCACLFPDPLWIPPLLAYVRANGLPLDFLSWHYYGNYPFTGPDGGEPIGPPGFREFLELIGHPNPATTAMAFSDQVALVRTWRDAAYPDGARHPEMVIDEWNLSAGGFDRRHDTAEGAAFDAAVLVEMQRAGLDRSAVFRSVDPAYGPEVVPPKPELYGGWGLVGRQGTRKPAWDVFRFWKHLFPRIVGLSSTLDGRAGVFAVVTGRNRGNVRILAANFQASGSHRHHLEVRLTGAARGRWTIRAVGAGGRERTWTARSDGTVAVRMTLPAQSAWILLAERRSAAGAAPFVQRFTRFEPK